MNLEEKANESLLCANYRRNKRTMKSKLIRGTAEAGQLRFFIGETTNMVEKARKIHHTSPVSSAALGRLLTASSMMGWMMKAKKDKLTLQVKGNGDISHIVSVSDSEGKTKGYITNTKAPFKLNKNGKLDVGGAVGSGQLLVIQDFGLKEPYIGQSDLVSGEIAEDIAAYFMYSKQEPSVVSLGVFVEKDYKIGAAGGFIIQPMPDCNPFLIDILEDYVKKLDSVTDIVKASDGDIKKMAEIILEPFQFEILEEKEVEYSCDCSRKKVERAVISLGKSEITKMIEEDGQAEVNCQFCNTNYVINKEGLKKLLDEAISS